jgi:pyruvate/2-oxoglutarate dehydrogenase complex dihydrolipoamide acyltransferase (E2) component
MEVIVPTLPESVDSAVISALYVREGESVIEGQVLLDIETSKVVLEITAVANGVISSVKVSLGDYVNSNQTLMELSGEDVILYEESETIEIDPESYGLEEEIGQSPTKKESSSFALWMGGLVLVILIISIVVKGL